LWEKVFLDWILSPKRLVYPTASQTEGNDRHVGRAQEAAVVRILVSIPGSKNIRVQKWYI
jgi:hypothetical protein